MIGAVWISRWADLGWLALTKQAWGGNTPQAEGQEGGAVLTDQYWVPPGKYYLGK